MDTRPLARIEALHHIRDVTYGEDASQTRTGNRPPGHGHIQATSPSGL
jgi:hypothetical protein